jgi:Flp pilus assembly protein TadG
MISQRGSVTVELVLLTPLLMILVLFGIYAGRASESLIQVRNAADQAARAASKGSRSQIQSTAIQIAERALNISGTSCSKTNIETTIISQGQDLAVLVKVSCEIKSQDLSLVGTRPRVVSASSVEVIDRWRVDT